MIVSNHLSWLDAFVLLGEVGARFVANSVWGAVPGLRTVLRANGVLFIERTRLRDTQQVGRRLHRLLGNGEPAVVFPEADTTRGERVLPFRPALLQPAASLGHPVAWLTLRYETPPGWPPASVVVSWADWTPLLVHMYRAFHPPWIAARIRFGEAPVAAPTRKELAAELYRRVAHDFEPQPQLPPDELASVTTPPPRPQRRF
jgi:1-acyl-sn-glycerol-3-phosphate acyltransferase